MQFQQPKQHWVELKYGPLLFRKHLDGGILVHGKTNEELLAYLHDPRGNIGDIAKVHINRDAATFDIHWEFVDERTGKRTNLKTRHPVDQIPKNPEQNLWLLTSAGLSSERLVHARNLYTKLHNTWNIMESEFRHAVRAGVCRLHARWNSASAPSFTMVPAEVFLRFRITGWQTGEAEGPDGERLYSIHLEEIEGRIPTLQTSYDVNEQPITRPPRITQRELEDWFTQRVKAHQDSDPMPTETNDWDAAKADFPDKRVTRAILRAAREKSTPLEWRKQGQRGR